MTAKPELEFEVKVALSQPADLPNLLASTQLVKESSGVDKYFDTLDRDLFLHGIFFRLRDQKVLEIKYNPDWEDTAHLKCDEHKFSWPLDSAARESVRHFLCSFLQSASEVQDPFLAFGLTEFVTIAKNRSVYLGDGFEVCVDKIEGLGTFLEIEAHGIDGINRVQTYCREHGLTNLPVGYVELWLRQHDFTLYRKGRYVLPEDQ